MNDIYLSKRTISTAQYNRAKYIIDKALVDNNSAYTPHDWNITWNKKTNKWQVKYRNSGCCPLGSVLLHKQPKRVKPIAPYDKLDIDDTYHSWGFAAISKTLNVPEDFIHGFISEIDDFKGTPTQYINMTNDELGSFFPPNKINNIKNFNKGKTLAKWVKKKFAMD